MVHVQLTVYKTYCTKMDIKMGKHKYLLQLINEFNQTKCKYTKLDTPQAR